MFTVKYISKNKNFTVKKGLVFMSNLVTPYFFFSSINLKLEENLLSILLERYCMINLKLVKFN